MWIYLRGLKCGLTSALTIYDPLTPLAQDMRFKPLGHNPDGLWIKVRVEGSEQLGWVANSTGFVSCNVSVTDLPVSEP